MSGMLSYRTNLNAILQLISLSHIILYLTLRGNAIADENALKYLGLMSKTLQVVVLSENPLVETLDCRQYVLMYAPQLERIDKEAVSPEERMEARGRIRVKQKQTSITFICGLVT